MSKALPKTNAMRQLDAAKIPYEVLTYEVDENDLSGTHIAEQIGLPLPMVFKTLVARGASKGIYVFCIPVADSLDLKKAAKAVGEKSIEMVAVKEINALTGYVRGGCSPVGMKKQYPTVFHETAEIVDTVIVSAGKIGYQVELSPAALIELVGGTLSDVTVA